MTTGDKFQRSRLFFLHLTFLRKKQIAGSGSYQDFSIRARAGAGAGAGAAETFYSEQEPEPEYFPAAGADQKCHGSASLAN